MAKTKSVWYCSECGTKQLKWSGQCPQCEKWNTFHEEVETPQQTPRFEGQRSEHTRPVRVCDISTGSTPRLCTAIAEFDTLLGGGIVPGSLILVGGDPGIGKSTLLMQVSHALAKQGLTVLYICGEESVEQTSLRARRLGADSDNLYLLNETNFSYIKAQVDIIKPHILIVDSIQIVYKPEISSAPGSVTQVRETATDFMHLAKGRGIATFLIGHVTKSGEIAGPRVLEHLVDTVLYFEGDKQQNYRLIRIVKNRFGATDEIAVFQMTANGLAEVPNPSEVFLEERRKKMTGSVIIPTLEGSRPILVEAQALVTGSSVYGTPSRRSAGVDQNRLALMLAVLEKRVGFRLHERDVFVSIAGGMKILETAVDIGVLLSIASSFCNKTVPQEMVAVGEVGLGGEIRSVPRIETRIKEAIRMGFDTCLIPKRNANGLSDDIKKNLKIIAVDNVDEAIKAVLQ